MFRFSLFHSWFFFFSCFSCSFSDQTFAVFVPSKHEALTLLLALADNAACTGKLRAFAANAWIGVAVSANFQQASSLHRRLDLSSRFDSRSRWSDRRILGSERRFPVIVASFLVALACDGAKSAFLVTGTIVVGAFFLALAARRVQSSRIRSCSGSRRRRSRRRRSNSRRSKRRRNRRRSTNKSSRSSTAAGGGGV